jgi:hypothetical protein
MARKDYDEKIAKARAFVEFHPESRGLLELIEDLAEELARAKTVFPRG